MLNRVKNYFYYKKIISKIHSIGLKPTIGANCIIIGGRNISIGDSFYSECNLHLQTWEIYRGKLTGYKPNLRIGDNVSFMSNCHVSCMNSVYIGNGCLFGDNVFIADNYHGNNNAEQLNLPPLERPLYSKGSIKIGDNVWVGRNVCILPNVSIGDYAIIGANSVVNKDIPDNCVAAGNPAKVIRKIR